ncbi:MAG: SRPBCC family protein [Nannocystaceae bacterium]|nr:SRPBCC family protein [Nannocystaceae bacterium]
MILLGVAVGTIAAGLGALAAYGASQPRDHVASRTIELDHTPAALFAILEDVSAYPCWRSGLSRVERVGDDPLRYVEHAGDDAIAYVVDERVPSQRLVVRIADAELPWGGSWTYELEPNGTGTRLTITERGYIEPILLRGIAALTMDPTASIAGVQEDLRRFHGCGATPPP